VPVAAAGTRFAWLQRAHLISPPATAPLSSGSFFTSLA
jgi:hypothetical protein